MDIGQAYKRNDGEGLGIELIIEFIGLSTIYCTGNRQVLTIPYQSEVKDLISMGTVRWTVCIWALRVVQRMRFIEK